VNQRYVIATSTRINLGALDVSNITDDFFDHETPEKADKEEVKFLKVDKEEVCFFSLFCLCDESLHFTLPQRPLTHDCLSLSFSRTGRLLKREKMNKNEWTMSYHP